MFFILKSYTISAAIENCIILFEQHICYVYFKRFTDRNISKYYLWYSKNLFRTININKKAYY